jgi:hypothetical protein
MKGSGEMEVSGFGFQVSGVRGKNKKLKPAPDPLPAEHLNITGNLKKEPRYGHNKLRRF